MSLTYTPCEGNCCCQCSYCAGDGYYTEWQVTINFAGSFTAGNPFDTSGGIGEPTVGTCKCSTLSYIVNIPMATTLDGVTGGLTESNDVGDRSSCCIWGLVNSAVSRAAVGDCGVTPLELFPFSNCASQVALTDESSLKLCGTKYTNGFDITTPTVTGARSLIQANIKVRGLTELGADCGDTLNGQLLHLGNALGSLDPLSLVTESSFSCEDGYTFSGADIAAGKTLWLNNNTDSGCYVSSVVFAPVGASWRQCGKNADGTTYSVSVSRPSPSSASKGTSTPLAIVRQDRCDNLGNREDFKTGCNGWMCGHKCKIGLPAVPGGYCQNCEKYEVDPDYKGKGVSGWLY